ncbi:MAG: hypothetical protein AAF483_24800, partial [Planctomycetota bacterium]
MPISSRKLNLEQLEVRNLLTTITVTTVADVVDGDTTSISGLLAVDESGDPIGVGADGEISLREAILAANNGNGPALEGFGTAVQILFDSSLSGQTIHLKNDVDDYINNGSHFETYGSFSIKGDRSDPIKISAGGQVTDGAPDCAGGARHFRVKGSSSSDTALLLDGVELIGGNTSLESGGAIYLEAQSGLTVRNSKLTGNCAVNGGAIFAEYNNVDVSFKRMHIESTQFEHNLADANGGAVYAEIRNPVTVSNSKIYPETTSGSFTIDSSSFVSNEADRGGALFIRNVARLSLFDKAGYPMAWAGAMSI